MAIMVAMAMPRVTTQKVPTTVRANQDLMETEKSAAKVNNNIRILSNINVSSSSVDDSSVSCVA